MICVHTADGQPVYLNPAHVVRFEPARLGGCSTVIYLTVGNWLQVVESCGWLLQEMGSLT